MPTKRKYCPTRPLSTCIGSPSVVGSGRGPRLPLVDHELHREGRARNLFDPGLDLFVQVKGQVIMAARILTG
jgi:hypothetical protein